MPVSPDKIVIIIPSYNEGARILKVVTAIKEHGFHNIVVVDDGSTDDSIELVRHLNITIIQHLVNRGAGAATETGLKYCREILNPETVVMIDADTQHDPNDIRKLIDAHENQEADITIGNRFMESRGNVPLRNWFYNQVANVVTGLIAGKNVRDSQSGFKVFNKRALNQIIVEQDKFEHCSEILIKGLEYNFKIIEVPIHVYYSPETSGKGQHFFNGIRTFINLMHSVLFKSHSK